MGCAGFGWAGFGWVGLLPSNGWSPSLGSFWLVGFGLGLPVAWSVVLGAAGLGPLGFGSLRLGLAGSGVVVLEWTPVWGGSVECGVAGRAGVGAGCSRKVCEPLLASRAGAAFLSLNEWDRVI